MRLLVRRHLRAANIVYRNAVRAGLSEQAALHNAEAALFEGLLFSPYQTVLTILAIGFPEIPSILRPLYARELVVELKHVFIRYPLGDDFPGTSAFREMEAELSAAIRRYLDMIAPSQF